MYKRQVRRRSRSARLRRIVPRVVEIAACVVLAVAVATPFAIANVEFIRSAVMKLLIRIDWDDGVMQMNLVEDEGAAFNVPADWPGEYFPSYLPEGLEAVSYTHLCQSLWRINAENDRESITVPAVKKAVNNCIAQAMGLAAATVARYNCLLYTSLLQST